jgi:hypothetical protein
MNVSKRKVKSVISCLEATVEIVEENFTSSDYKRGYKFAIMLCIQGIKSEILNK